MVFGNEMRIRSANITPHPTSGIGNLTFEDFKKATEGQRPDGKMLRPLINRMKLDSIEINAIWHYQKSVNTISNEWGYETRIEIPAI